MRPYLCVEGSEEHLMAELLQLPQGGHQQPCAGQLLDRLLVKVQQSTHLVEQYWPLVFRLSPSSTRGGGGWGPLLAGHDNLLDSSLQRPTDGLCDAAYARAGGCANV